METTQETIVDDDGGRELAIARTDTSEAPSLSKQTQSQDIQGQYPACSSNDVQYIERRIMQRLDDSSKESFRSLINSIERRFSDLETNLNKIQDQLQSIQQQLPAQNFRGHESLICLQFAEDLEKEDERSTDSYANVHAYVQGMQKYQREHGARHLPPQRPPSRVMRQRRISSRYSLTYPFVTDTITL